MVVNNYFVVENECKIFQFNFSDNVLPELHHSESYFIRTVNRFIY